MFRSPREIISLLLLFCLTVGAARPAWADDPDAAALVGHWRKTTIRFEQPRDEHLLLGGDGTMSNWVVTAESQTEPVSGTWQVEGNILTIGVDGQVTMSQPFTFYQGQLVFPNVQNRRGFWTRIAD
jgi:hypothetical protein